MTSSGYFDSLMDPIGVLNSMLGIKPLKQKESTDDTQVVMEEVPSGNEETWCMLRCLDALQQGEAPRGVHQQGMHTFSPPFEFKLSNNFETLSSSDSTSGIFIPFRDKKEIQFYNQYPQTPAVHTNDLPSIVHDSDPAPCEMWNGDWFARYMYELSLDPKAEILQQPMSFGETSWEQQDDGHMVPLDTDVEQSKEHAYDPNERPYGGIRVAYINGDEVYTSADKDAYFRYFPLNVGTTDPKYLQIAYELAKKTGTLLSPEQYSYYTEDLSDEENL